MRMMMRLMAGVVTLTMITGSAAAAVLTVYPDGNGPYPTIQAAVNDAGEQGDIIKLMDGVYSGPGNYNIDLLGKAITVASSSNDPESCIIDVNGIHGNLIPERGFLITSGEGHDTVIRGITIMNGDADGPCPQCEGGGAWIVDSSPTFINVVFRNNYAENGAGIFAGGRGSQPEFYDCKFINNTGKSGIGAELIDHASAYFEKCVFAGNKWDGVVGLGGAIRAFNWTTLRLNRSTVVSNEAPAGSAFEFYNSHVFIESSIIANNRGGDPILVSSESDVVVRYSNIWGNDGHDWPKDFGDQLHVNGNLAVDPRYEWDISKPGVPVGLLTDSPMIDAGAPDDRDPDGTRADIGAYYYHQSHFDRGTRSSGTILAADDQGSDGPAIPDEFTLVKIAPNPFNASTIISLRIPDRAKVNVRVLDVLGREVAVVHEGVMDAGTRSLSFNAGKLPSGLYFVEAMADGYGRNVEKIALVR